MKNAFKILTLCAASFAAHCVAAPVVLWYNGDFDGRTALANEMDATIAQAAVYDDFVVPVGQTWTISSVFSNNLFNSMNPTTALWEIRSGVSAGNGGTIVASGTDAATTAMTGRSGFGLDEFNVTVSGLNVVLGPGTYWLSVVPIDPNGTRSFLSLTSGANSVGMPAGNNDNSFFNSSDFSANFAVASSFAGFTPADFSEGVIGTTNAETVPEPATLGLIGLSIAGLLFRKK